MPTERPRVTFTISKEQLDEVESFRFEEKMKNQTQAILALLRSGIEIYKEEQKNAPVEELDEDEKEAVKELRKLDGRIKIMAVGELKHIVREYEAAEAAKQINKEMA